MVELQPSKLKTKGSIPSIRSIAKHSYAVGLKAAIWYNPPASKLSTPKAVVKAKRNHLDFAVKESSKRLK